MKVCSLASRTGFFVSQRHWAAANFDSTSADAKILKTRRSARSVKVIFGRQSPGCEELSVPHRVEFANSLLQHAGFSKSERGVKRISEKFLQAPRCVKH
jgi:hypothetical protein